MKKRVLSLFLALALILSAAPLAFAAGEPGYATRGQVVDMLLTAADDYTEGLKRSDIIKGDGGGLREDEFITRAEAIVMVSRAFGELSAPTGHNARITVTDLSFDDVPFWAVPDVENLVNGGVLVGTGGGKLSPNDTVTAQQVQTMITRIFMLKGQNLKDSFYATVNREELNNLTIKPGEMAAGTFITLTSQNTERLSGIIENILSGTHAKDSREQKVSDFYLSVADMEGRNKAGSTPIQAYLQESAAIKNLDDAFTLRATVMKDTGAGLLLSFALGVDAKDSTKYAMNFAPAMSPQLLKDDYADENGQSALIYKEYLKTMLSISGLGKEEAAAGADAIFSLEKKLAESMMDRQDYGNVDLIYNEYTMAELQALHEGIDLLSVLKGDGYKEERKYIVTDVGLMEAYAEALKNATDKELQVYTRMSLINGFAGALSQDYMDASNQFTQQMYGVVGERSAEELAVLYTQSMMSDYLGEIYVEKYFSPEAKADVEEMVAEFIAIYKDRIKKLDWMSEQTKQMALKKLDTMNVKIGYPDDWSSYLDLVSIKGPKDGGSFYQNLVAMNLLSHKALVAAQGRPMGEAGWLVSAYTVNAYYLATSNEIVFPAGILQAPFYDVNASREENLGGIGFIIAHEITHSFDNNGAKFDENGNAKNWWTDADFEKFNALCLEVIAYYDGHEYAPGIVNNGTLTLSENIADLGAIACVVETAQKMDAPDYEKLFLNMAKCWTSTYSREYMAYLSQLDVHSADAVRVDRAAQSTPIFYETFGIEQGDGMYLAPEERVSIW